MLKKLALALALVLPATLAQDEAKRGPVLPEVGKPAPVIRLNDHEGRAVRLGPGASERWSVLAYFPKAATPG